MKVAAECASVVRPNAPLPPQYCLFCGQHSFTTPNHKGAFGNARIGLTIIISQIRFSYPLLPAICSSQLNKLDTHVY